MASNSKISVRRNRDSLQLKLVGDFDGTTACELLNIPKKKCDSSDRVIIDTGGPKDIYAFVRDTFVSLLTPFAIKCLF